MEQVAHRINRQTKTIHKNELQKQYVIQASPYRSKILKMVISTLVWCGILMITVISANVRLTNAQLKLQDTTNEITKVQNSNTNMKQEISELSNKSRLNKIAKDSDLKMNTKNTRNVTK